MYDLFFKKYISLLFLTIPIKITNRDYDRKKYTKYIKDEIIMIIIMIKKETHHICIFVKKHKIIETVLLYKHESAQQYSPHTN